MNAKNRFLVVVAVGFFGVSSESFAEHGYQGSVAKQRQDPQVSQNVTGAEPLRRGTATVIGNITPEQRDCMKRLGKKSKENLVKCGNTGKGVAVY